MKNPVLFLINCLGIQYFLASQLAKTAAQPQQGTVNFPRCGMSLKAAELLNQSLLFIWGFMPGEQCGRAPANEYFEVAARCNATFFGNVTRQITMQDSAISLCQGNQFQLLIDARNNTASAALDTLIHCFQNQTFIQQECVARHESNQQIALYGGILVGVLCYCACVCSYLFATKSSGNNSLNKTERSYLMDDVEMQNPAPK